MKKFLRRIKTIYLIIIGKIDSRQNVVSLDSIYGRLRKEAMKYTNDPFIHASCTKMSGSILVNEGDSRCKYTLYSNEPFPKFVYSNDLELAFEQMNWHLSGKGKPKKDMDKIIVSV